MSTTESTPCVMLPEASTLGIQTTISVTPSLADVTAPITAETSSQTGSFSRFFSCDDESYFLMFLFKQYGFRLLVIKQQRYFCRSVVRWKSVPGTEFDGHIPIERIEKRFMRSSGPGGQNVNMVNTKCQIRFNLNEADWLSDEIRQIFQKRFARTLNKQCDVVISSDKSRIQSENQEDCFERLKAMLLDCSKELQDSKPPTNEDIKILEDRAKKAMQRRLYTKRLQSAKKRSRDPYESI